MNSDQTIREQALQPGQSFIVQAPAGSGKTELLVQRFLMLLAGVERAPEEIIALTFTRKAANEMRHRILLALQEAQNPEPSETHRQQTWRLANAVLQQDQQKQWHLLQNPNRLRVLTLDALCGSLVRQMPVACRFGVMPQPTENANELYLEAARRLLAMLDDNGAAETQALTQLLLHLDNRVSDVEKLIMAMLARRDQWLPHIMSQRQLSMADMRTTLEQGLRDIVMDALQNCYQLIPGELQPEITTLTRYAANQCSAEFLQGCQDLDIFPSPQLSQLPIFLAMAQLCLTNEHEWRVAVDKRIGFSPDNKAMKMRMVALIAQLSGIPGLRQRWQDLREAPPIHYSESQWQIVAALMQLLPLSVAQLTLLFQEHGCVDFTETSLAAQRALGDDYSPTDLALKLDYQIQHVLVDEFQDTSITQFRLLEQLTRGWQAGDGRTLFLVGDPMQSIYRFRAAEVGLFLKAQQEGIGQTKLTPLRLTHNFRATPTLVNWTNTYFRSLFPEYTDISAGAVPYHDSIAAQTDTAGSGIYLQPLLPSENMGERVRQIVQQQLREQPQASVAILVRSRTKLMDIIPLLKKAGLSFQAVEIESLARQSIVRDLMALTRALLHLGDRIAWLAILRAPWCGLTLMDLHAISGGSQPLWQNIQACHSLPLSADGQRRVAHLSNVLHYALSQYQRLALRPWLEQTWQALRGPDCLLDATEYSAATAYFELLEEFDARGQWPDIAQLEQQIQDRYATIEATDTTPLHVMTIHKAKGLEFDTVIIPHLEGAGRHDDEQLLLWQERPRRKNQTDLLLAPVKAKKEEHDPIYRYLLQTESRKKQFEMSRLLYVAVTRAKKNLHLLGFIRYQQEEVKLPVKQSFLHMLWSAFQPVIEKETRPIEIVEGIKVSPKPSRHRIILSETPSKQPINNLESPGFYKNAWPKESEGIHKAIGSVIHRCLQKISQNKGREWCENRLQQEQVYWRNWLLQYQVPEAMLIKSLAYIQLVINNTWQDPRGRWLLHNHAEAQSEWALTTLHDGQPLQVIIDRSFVDEQQVRWIIDYKTEPAAFFSEEFRTDKLTLRDIQDKYGEQLEKYACAVSQLDTRTIKLGIYLPERSLWFEWDWTTRPHSRTTTESNVKNPVLGC